MPNTRRCPFYGCHQLIDPKFFACRHHWPELGDDDRAVIWSIYDAYLKGDMHIDELVRKQGEVMLKNTPQTVPGALAKTATVGEIELARKVKDYIIKRKEYTACKDGFLDRKKKLGMELSSKEKALAELCQAILHPKQNQPTLFDSQDEPKMPD